MAKDVKSNSAGRKNSAVRSDRQKMWRAAGGVALFFIIMAGLFYGIAAIGDLLFTENPRFRLRHIQVNTIGFWKGRDDLLTQRIGLSTGSNLFALNLRNLRQKLLDIPCIEDASVELNLPDRVCITLTERLPRAALDPARKWVVDENAVVMLGAESMGNKLRLPLISAGPTKVQPGGIVTKMRPGLELIMVALNNFPDIHLSNIVIRDDPDRHDHCRVIFYMQYRDWRQYRVIMPLHRKKNNRQEISGLLAKLQSAILNAEWKGDTRTKFDLSYSGQVVLN